MSLKGAFPLNHDRRTKPPYWPFFQPWTCPMWNLHEKSLRAWHRLSVLGCSCCLLRQRPCVVHPIDSLSVSRNDTTQIGSFSEGMFLVLNQRQTIFCLNCYSTIVCGTSIVFISHWVVVVDSQNPYSIGWYNVQIKTLNTKGSVCTPISVVAWSYTSYYYA